MLQQPRSFPTSLFTAFRFMPLIVAITTIAVHAITLDTLVIEGLSINSERVVRNAIPLRENKAFATTDIQESIRNLYDLGLFDAVDIFVLTENDSSASLKLVLREFTICDTVEFHGNKKLKKKDLEEKCSLKRNQLLSKSALFDEEQRLQNMYAEKGYNLAKITYELIPTTIPGKSIVKYTINEGPRVKIKGITFFGNKEVKSVKLARTFKTKESRWWRSGEFKRDIYREHLDSLILFYNDLGYLDASVVSDSVWFTDSTKDIMIQIVLDEGNKYYAGRFSFKGNSILPTDSLQNKIALKYGKPFQKSRFEMSKYMIENTYREEGYLWVQVSESRSFRKDTVDILFDVYEGRSAVVRKVDIKGNTKTMEKVVRREIDLLPGEKYKQSLMMRSRQKILALGFFSDVKPDLAPNEDGTIDLVFDIGEKDNIGQLQVGAAYSQLNRFIGTFSTAIPNFRGTGQELRVNVEYGEDQRDISLSFTEPWAFDRPVSFQGSVFYSDNSYRSYYTLKQWGFEIGSGLSRMSWPDEYFRLSGSYQFSYSEGRRYGIDTVSDFNLFIDPEGFTSSISLTLTRYDLDIPMFPTEGTQIRFSPEIVGLGGTYNFIKNVFSYEHYFPLPYKFVLGSRTKVGLISPLFGDITIANHALFRLGGTNYSNADLRGYVDAEFGGLSDPGYRDYTNPENGLSMFATTIDLRYPLLEQQLYLGVFADAGNTFASFRQINPFNLYKSVGTGVRINIPMLGLMGVDFSWGLDDPTPRHFDTEPRGFKLEFIMNRGY